MDIAHIAMTVANGRTLDDQLDKLEDQVAVSYQIERKVADIYRLQDDYQEFLKQAETVQDLQADELRRLLITNQNFSMTDAERLETLRRMQDHLLSSQQLKAKADALMQQTSRPSFQKKQALDAFRKAQERRVLADVPLFQD